MNKEQREILSKLEDHIAQAKYCDKEDRIKWIGVLEAEIQMLYRADDG